jgi:hypothetical protein
MHCGPLLHGRSLRGQCVVTGHAMSRHVFVRSHSLAHSLAPCRYNLTLIERLWTSYVSLGLHPVVELSFMPSFLGNCSWHINPPDCHADEGLPCSAGKGPSCPMLMAYVVPSPAVVCTQKRVCQYVL